ncbi:MAG: accessory gene regulator B family protein [Oscillospiraceae bacterium]|nr:accessory gene regulator B family protein [Oscillospiraceae bacterium]
MVIHKQASSLADKLVKIKVVEKRTQEVYTYGFELIISGMLNVMLMATIAALLRRYYDWILFLIAFIPLRTTAGGYHASSHAKCILVGTLSFSALLVVSKLQIEWTIANLIIASLSLLIMFLLSPVEAKNKKLKEKQVNKNRKISIGIGIGNLLVAIIAVFIYGISSFLAIYFAGVFAAALSMIIAKKINLQKGRN